MQQFDVVIVGAGAAGLMCAAVAGARGRSVLLLDHAKKAGEKIRISGGGRCNFTNIHASPKQYLSQNPHFCVSAMKRYTAQDFIALVERHGIAYHEKTLGQLFCDGSSQQIIDMLLKECADAGVQIRLQTSVEKLEAGYALTLSDGSNVQAESVVIATGGPSIPKMGASAWGYKVAEQFGLKMVPPRAALVPFTLQTPLTELAGVSLPVRASCNGTHFDEAMLFTHRGLSGPAILQISSYWQSGDVLHLNLLPNQDALAVLKHAREEHSKQDVQTVLAGWLPKKLAQYLCAQWNLSGRMAEQGNKALEKLATQLQDWQIIPSGTEGYRTAEVTIGGVDTDELSSKTMEAKHVAGLYFIGEVVDVTGWLGGYNFQWAWASGVAAGEAV